MLLYIDLDTETLLTGPGTNEPLRSISFKRGKNSVLEVRFYRSGTRSGLSGGATGIFAVKTTGKYDGVPLVQDGEWTASGSGITAAYKFEPSFNTAALNEALGHGDGNQNNDLSSITAMGEIQWTDADGIHKTQTFEVLIENDVIKDGDIPSPPGETFRSWLAQHAIIFDSTAEPLTAPPEQGVKGVSQSYLFRLNGTVTASGVVTFTLYDPSHSPVVVLVTVLAGDTGTVLNTKVRDQLMANEAFVAQASVEFDTSYLKLSRLVMEESTGGFDLTYAPNSVTGTTFFRAGDDEGVAPIAGTPAEGLGELKLLIVDPDRYFFRCTSLDPFLWEGASPGLHLNADQGVWQIARIIGAPGSEEFAIVTI